MLRPTPTCLAALSAVGLLSLAAHPAPHFAAPRREASRLEVDFLKDVRPILEARCFECHGEKKKKAGLRFDRTSEGLFDAGDEGAVLVAGKPDESLLFRRVSLPAGDLDIMPAEGDPLRPEQIETLRAWIAEGAEWVDPEPAAEAPPKDELVLAELSADQLAAEAAALEKLAARGFHALRVAADTEALDLNLSLFSDAVGDAEMALLAGLEPRLVWLNLSRTKVGDAGLAEVARCKELRRLNLSRTEVGDAGLAALAGLPHLAYLNLYGTGVSDAGLAHLAGLAKLEKLYLWQTRVTDAGVAKLKAALPGLVVNLGSTLEPPKPDERPADAAVNATCPLSKKPVAAEHFSIFEGQRVGFCCPDCKAKFDADPQAFIDKVEGLKRKDEKQAALRVEDAVRATCPFSGEPIRADSLAPYQGKVVGFCNPGCRDKFVADPESFLELLPELGRE